MPEKNQPFLDVVDGERRGHRTARRHLLGRPDLQRPARPAAHSERLRSAPTRAHDRLLHGNEATLSRDVRERQQVPRQVTQSGLNAVLVAPQFAVNALDSSPGRFWEPGVFAQFIITEAGERLTVVYGDERARGRSTPRRW